jgi:putative intracellular protease/amidase
MHIAILTFDGFNELDSLIALGVLNRIKKPGWRVTLCCPTPEVTSMNGVTVRAQSLLEEARDAGAVVLARLGLVAGVPACTDLTTKPWVQEAGVEVLNQPFFARGNVATAGGCFASPYLAAWIIARAEGLEAATSALHYVAPVGEKEAYVANALKNITPYLAQ